MSLGSKMCYRDICWHLCELSPSINILTLKRLNIFVQRNNLYWKNDKFKWNVCRVSSKGYGIIFYIHYFRIILATLSKYSWPKVATLEIRHILYWTPCTIKRKNITWRKTGIMSIEQLSIQQRIKFCDCLCNKSGIFASR